MTEKMFPAAVEEDQEALANMEMEPIKISTPPFDSPDPRTSQGRMVPLIDDAAHAEAKGVSSADADGDEEDSGEKKLAGDWKDEVDAASTQDELDAVANAYAESGDDFSSVEKAIEKKQAEFNDQ